MARDDGDRDNCELCGKPIATYEDGKMQTTDTRIANFCWARREDGDTCPVERARLDRIARSLEPQEWDERDDWTIPFDVKEVP